MRNCFACFILLLVAFLQTCHAQTVQKVYFQPSDSASGYYLSILPQSGKVRGTLLFLNSFAGPEWMLAETNLHNIAYGNDLLTVYVSMGMKLYADSGGIGRIEAVVADLVERYHIDASQVVLGGFGNAGTIALRYAELSNERPSAYALHPRAVFGADSPVDVAWLWQWSERTIRKNFYPGAVEDARLFFDVMKKEHGSPAEHAAEYKALTPFSKDETGPGNEQWLAKTPVRLYYDADITWMLTNRRYSLYDTPIPDGTEMLNRLLLMGNRQAEYIPASRPGMRSNGVRHPESMSMVDAVDCIQWVKRSLGIFDPISWKSPYVLPSPAKWNTERFALPPDDFGTFSLKGVEELRFHPDWSDASSDGYWSYVYLWWMDGAVKVDAAMLSSNLGAYYDGLTGRNISLRHIPAEKVFKSEARVSEVAKAEGDLKTWSAIIRFLDYMSQRPLVLHGIIHLKDVGSSGAGCSGKTAVLIEVSPQTPGTSSGNAVWRKMETIAAGFTIL